jgi:hypothetical protein
METFSNGLGWITGLLPVLFQVSPFVALSMVRSAIQGATAKRTDSVSDYLNLQLEYTT